MNLSKSQKLHARALEIIPGGTNTNAKRIDQFSSPEHFPVYIEKARGAYVWDLDGNTYIDYIAALAPINIGYNDPRIKAKVQEQLEKGSLFSLPSANEVELSEVLIDKIPCAEMVKLMKTGADVTSAAVRAARLSTGKDMILSCGYHGWHDWWSAKVGHKGIPDKIKQLIRDFPYNDFPALERLVDEFDGNIACIILTAADYGKEPKNDFLVNIRKLADRKGIALIFDEIITGFRWSLGGAQQKYGVTPDMAAFAKGMANGMPIAALVGKKEFMAPLKNTLVTSTYASEALSIAASLETIRIIEADNITDRLYSLSDKIRAGLKKIGDDHGIDINTFDPTPTVKFELNVPQQKEKATIAFVNYCAAHGVLTRPFGSEIFLCVIAALSDKDLDRTLNIFDDAIKSIL